MRANSSKMEKGSKWRCATWIAGLALVVALASLAFTIIQRNELNTYRRLSAKPILLIDRILAPTQGYDGVGIYLRNGGNGIATILGGSVTYGDMRLDHENGPLATIAELIATQNPGFPYITSRLSVRALRNRCRLAIRCSYLVWMPPNSHQNVEPC